MDPQLEANIERATALLVLVVPYLAMASKEAVKALGKKIGEGTAAKLHSVGKSLWLKLSKNVEAKEDEEAKFSMDLFSEDPIKMHGHIRNVLEVYMVSDSGFASDVTELMGEIGDDEAPALEITQITQKGGSIQVGEVSGGSVWITQSGLEDDKEQD